MAIRLEDGDVDLHSRNRGVVRGGDADRAVLRDERARLSDWALIAAMTGLFIVALIGSAGLW